MCLIFVLIRDGFIAIRRLNRGLSFGYGSFIAGRSEHLTETEARRVFSGGGGLMRLRGLVQIRRDFTNKPIRDYTRFHRFTEHKSL